MEIGMLPLSRMRANRFRLLRGGHRYICFDREPEELKQSRMKEPAARRHLRIWSIS